MLAAAATKLAAMDKPTMLVTAATMLEKGWDSVKRRISRATGEVMFRAKVSTLFFRLFHHSLGQSFGQC
jgi:hypothetical protein